MMASILVVDDEQDILTLVAYHLRPEGYRVLTAADGKTAVDLALNERPDLIVLDLMLPEMSGLEVLKILRGNDATRKTPVILLTARKDEIDRVLGLELGADDYVTKPFSPRELVLRVRLLLKRASAAPEPDAERLRYGPFEIDLENHLARVDGHPLNLTLTEFRLLTDLVRARGRVRSRDSLLGEVWGYNNEVMSRTVDTHIRRLRQKLGPAAPRLGTLRGVGYRLQASEED
jgi:two-component system phosphate regulon response regulator PhoB